MKPQLQARQGTVHQLHFKLDHETDRILRKLKVIAGDIYDGPVTDAVLIRRALRELMASYLETLYRQQFVKDKIKRVEIGLNAIKEERDRLVNAAKGYPVDGLELL